MTGWSFARTTATAVVGSRRDGGGDDSQRDGARAAGARSQSVAPAPSVPGWGGQALGHLVDLLADGRRPLRARARDRVRDSRSLRRHLLVDLQPDPAVAR